MELGRLCTVNIAAIGLVSVSAVPGEDVNENKDNHNTFSSHADL